MEPKKNIKSFNGFDDKKNVIGLPSNDFEISPQTHRYMMEFPLYGVMYECWVNCELPSLSIGYNHHNGIRNHQWQPIRVKIRDLIGNDQNGLEFYNKLRSWLTDYNYNKINTTLSMLNLNGTLINRWDLWGCFVSDIYYGVQESELEITLHYDYCKTNYYDI